MFSKNWDEIVQGDLAQRKEVSIAYDAARLPGRDKRYGQRAWDIFAEVKYADNGAVLSARLEGPEKNTTMMTTTLTIPSNATTLIMWFKHWGYYSGYSYDSDYGKNYEFSFNQIVFTSTWDEYVNGYLYPGGQFDVLYDKRRLPWNDRGYLGLGRAWNIFALAKFSENGPVVKKMLKGPVGGDPTMNTNFEIPLDAKKVIMWFYFTGYIHTIRYDSNHGANYKFSLSNQ